MDAHLDEIVDFSELKVFLDAPVDHFFSGVLARLGILIASIEEAEIMIVDEILAVGNAAFQRKCEQKMDKLLSGGTTLIFVSHSGEQVKRLCKRAVWLDHGQVQKIGGSSEVYDVYQRFLDNGCQYRENQL